MRRMAEELIKRADVLKALYNLPKDLVNGKEMLWAEMVKAVCNIPSKSPKEEEATISYCHYDPLRKIHIYICGKCGYRSCNDFDICPKCNARIKGVKAE